MKKTIGALFIASTMLITASHAQGDCESCYQNCATFTCDSSCYDGYPKICNQSECQECCGCMSNCANNVCSSSMRKSK